jgi:hypothetical protein
VAVAPENRPTAAKYEDGVAGTCTNSKGEELSAVYKYNLEGSMTVTEDSEYLSACQDACDAIAACTGYTMWNTDSCFLNGQCLSNCDTATAESVVAVVKGLPWTYSYDSGRIVNSSTKGWTCHKKIGADTDAPCKAVTTAAACVVPKAAFTEKARGCATDNNCFDGKTLNNNTGFDTFAEAWAACGDAANAGCAHIIHTPNNFDNTPRGKMLARQYFLRKDTDPIRDNLPNGGMPFVACKGTKAKGAKAPSGEQAAAINRMAAQLETVVQEIADMKADVKDIKTGMEKFDAKWDTFLNAAGCPRTKTRFRFRRAGLGP